jgi:hypothetical protein
LFIPAAHIPRGRMLSFRNFLPSPPPRVYPSGPGSGVRFQTRVYRVRSRPRAANRFWRSVSAASSAYLQLFKAASSSGRGDEDRDQERRRLLSAERALLDQRLLNRL